MSGAAQSRGAAGQGDVWAAIDPCALPLSWRRGAGEIEGKEQTRLRPKASFYRPIQLETS